MSNLDVPIVKLTVVSDDGFIRIAIKAKEEEEEKEEKENEEDSLESNDKSSSQNLPSADEESKIPLLRLRGKITRFLSNHYKLFKNIFLVAFFVSYMVYYGFAMAYSISSATVLTVFTSIGILVIAYNWVSDHYGPQINRIAFRPLKHLLQRHWSWIGWLLGTTILAASMLYIFLFAIKTLRQVRCFFGAIIFLMFAYLTSKRPDKIRWSFVGLALFVQLLIGVIVLRWPTGFTAVNSILHEIAILALYYPMAGAAAVYGDPLFLLHPIAMFVTSIIIYAGSLILVLYSLTRVIRLVRYGKRWLPRSTDSQLHLCLVSTHALLSGFALTFVSVAGENIHHMVTGMALCLPAGIAFSLINFPETEKSTFSFKAQAVRDARPRPKTNVFLMGFQGCVLAAKVVISIYANVLAFTSIYAFFDSVYSWLASRLGIETNITDTLGYAFMPISYLMGVRWEECYVVGCLVAEKITGLVLRAFRDLGWMITLNELQNDTAVIATHALLGFSTLGTLCAWMGFFAVVAPRHRPRMMSMYPRIMLNINLILFYSASVAVVLSPESEYENPGTMTGNQMLLLWFLKSLPSYRDLMSLANQ